MRFESETVVLDSDWKKTNHKKRGDEKRNPFRKDETQKRVPSKATKEKSAAPENVSRARRTAFSSESSWRPLSLSLSLSGGGCSEEKGRKNVVSETGSFLKCLKRLKNPKFIREKKKTVEKTHDRGKM